MRCVWRWIARTLDPTELGSDPALWTKVVKAPSIAPLAAFQASRRRRSSASCARRVRGVLVVGRHSFRLGWQRLACSRRVSELTPRVQQSRLVVGAAWHALHASAVDTRVHSDDRRATVRVRRRDLISLPRGPEISGPLHAVGRGVHSTNRRAIFSGDEVHPSHLTPLVKYATVAGSPPVRRLRPAESTRKPEVSTEVAALVASALSADDGFDLDRYLAQARVDAFKAATRATARFAALLADGGDRDADRMLRVVICRLEGVDAALADGDLGAVHRLLDKANHTMERLSGYCLARQRGLAPVEAAVVEAAEEERINALIDAAPDALRPLIAGRHESIRVHREHFVSRFASLVLPLVGTAPATRSRESGGGHRRRRGTAAWRRGDSGDPSRPSDPELAQPHGWASRRGGAR